MVRFLLWLFLMLLFPISAVAQQAIVVDLGNGNYVGVLILADGTVHPIAKLTIVKPSEPPAPHHAKRATFIWEKDSNPVPGPVAAALQKINAEHPEIVATEFEEDTVDGTGEVPAQYSKSLAAARKAGLPCLVVEAEDGTITVVPNPKTMEAVLAAVGLK